MGHDIWTASTGYQTLTLSSIDKDEDDFMYETKFL